MAGDGGALLLIVIGYWIISMIYKSVRELIINPVNNNEFKKVFNECQNCGNITDNVVLLDGTLLCEECLLGEPAVQTAENVNDNINENIFLDEDRLLPVAIEVELPTHSLIIDLKNNFNKDSISKAKVSLKNDTDKLEQISDIDGKVIFGKIPEGVYNLNINYKGFEEYSKDITVNKNDKITVELKGEASLIIRVMDIINEVGISDAVVKINDTELITGTNGVVIIPAMEFGTYGINITKESYKHETISVEVTGAQQEVKVFLRPDIKLNEEFANKAVIIHHSLKEAMNKLSSACDMGIPGYYKSICLELVKFNEDIASTPVYVYSEKSNEKIEALYKITEQICKEIEIVLTNSENISEYINMNEKGIKTIPSMSINLSDYGSMLHAYFDNSTDFSVKYKSNLLNKLQEIDKEITNNIQAFNINPIAHLWGISHIIINGEKNEYEGAASILLINILLDCTKNMFENDGITKRLRK